MTMKVDAIPATIFTVGLSTRTQTHALPPSACVDNERLTYPATRPTRAEVAGPGPLPPLRPIRTLSTPLAQSSCATRHRAAYQ